MHQRLTAQQRDALLQTIAAEALEGWSPTAENTSDLVDLLLGRVLYGAYLGKYLGRARENHGHRQRKLIARRRPYLIPGTTVLRNNFDIEDAAALQHLEFVSTAGRLVRMHTRTTSPDGVADPLVLHQELFADVYSWAGRLRIVDIRKGDSWFAPVDILDERMAEIITTATEIAGSTGTDSVLAYRLAQLYALYNHTHPFREGNGRTGTLFLQRVAARSGRRLDLTAVTRADWLQASRDSMPFRRDGVPDHRPFLGVLLRALTPRVGRT
ncbi:Fic family protein [Antrihabitans sp. YC2-6]|nr:Fic family protein [Antrihabitans sp. YC2-6]